MLTHLLQTQGYEVQTATSVEEARVHLATSSYGVAICDVRMPGELVLTLVRDIGVSYPETEVIMLTAVDDPEYALAAIELGAFAYLNKPFKAKDLLINVASALHNRTVKMKARADKEMLARKVRERTEALKNTARHYREMVALSLTDELTGLRNYRYFRSELESELQRAARYDHSLSLLVFDIDHFKDINDRFGHRRGDAVLAEVAARLSPQIRPQIDSFARYGGEEFAVILPETTKEGALVVGERIRRILGERPFEAELEDGLAVTASVGIASYPDDAVNAEALFRAADWAMFRAKSRGRNCVALAGDEEADEETYAGLEEETIGER